MPLCHSDPKHRDEKLAATCRLLKTDRQAKLLALSTHASEIAKRAFFLTKPPLFKAWAMNFEAQWALAQ